MQVQVEIKRAMEDNFIKYKQIPMFFFLGLYSSLIEDIEHLLIHVIFYVDFFKFGICWQFLVFSLRK